MRLIDAIGHKLSLKAEEDLRSLNVSALEGISRVLDEVTAVELNAGRVGVDLHCTSGKLVVSLASLYGSLGLAALEVEAVVVTACDNKILIVGVDILADLLCDSEVEGSSLYATKLAGRNKVLVNGEIGISIKLKLDGIYVTCRIAAEVEVRVVSEVNDGGLIGSSVVVDLPAVLLGESISNREVEVSGESLVSVLGDGVKNERGLVAVKLGTSKIFWLKPILPPWRRFPLSSV